MFVLLLEFNSELAPDLLSESGFDLLLFKFDLFQMSLVEFLDLLLNVFELLLPDGFFVLKPLFKHSIALVLHLLLLVFKFLFHSLSKSGNLVFMLLHYLLLLSLPLGLGLGELVFDFCGCAQHLSFGFGLCRSEVTLGFLDGGLQLFVTKSQLRTSALR